jgi:hypothetical protein
MNTLFTFPHKNPKYMNLCELKKTCTYLCIQHNNIKKNDLIVILNNYYLDKELSHHRIQINFHDEFYYINTYCKYYKSLIKTYDDEYREVYKLTHINGKMSYTVRYSKLKNEWEMEVNGIKPLSIGVDLKFRTELDRLRNITLYLELKYIYMNFYFQELLIKDVFNYIMNHYKNIISLPSECYTIL